MSVATVALPLPRPATESFRAGPATLAEALRAFRAGRGLSIRAAGGLVGGSRGVWAKWESGVVPSPVYLRRIAGLLGLSGAEARGLAGPDRVRRPGSAGDEESPGLAQARLRAGLSALHILRTRAGQYQLRVIGRKRRLASYPFRLGLSGRVAHGTGDGQRNIQFHPGKQEHQALPFARFLGDRIARVHHGAKPAKRRDRDDGQHEQGDQHFHQGESAATGACHDQRLYKVRNPTSRRRACLGWSGE